MTGELQIVYVARDSYAGAFTDGRFFAGVVRDVGPQATLRDLLSRLGPLPDVTDAAPTMPEFA